MSLFEELTELAERATPGPWEALGSDPAEGFDCFWLRGPKCDIGSINGMQADSEQRANAALIVKLRNALPDILAALQERNRLREALHEIIAHSQKHIDDTDAYVMSQYKIEAARAALEQPK